MNATMQHKSLALLGNYFLGEV